MTRTAFTTAADFFQKMLRPDYEDYQREQGDLRRALHVANSLFHMADWVFNTHEIKVRAGFTYKDRKGTELPVKSVTTFCNALEQINSHFGRIRGIANAGKHLILDDVRPVPNAPSHSANTFVVQVGTTYLLPLLRYVPFSWGRPNYTIYLEGDHGAHIKFSTIAENTYNMWLTLNATHGWW